jgi:hypothetical protein
VVVEVNYGHEDVRIQRPSIKERIALETVYKVVNAQEETVQVDIGKSMPTEKQAIIQWLMDFRL